VVLNLAIGLMAGVLSGLFGIGGGVLIVPSLIILARHTPARATGTSLAALLLPVGALGAWEYYRRGDVDVPAALLIALGIFAGAWLGAHWAVRLPPRALQRGFAAFLVVVAVHLWTSA
jgi:uncharacterized membrane protein YfcA